MYLGVDLDDMLNEVVWVYVNDYWGVKIENGKLVVLLIYNWFKEDFGGIYEGIIVYLIEYVDFLFKLEL